MVTDSTLMVFLKGKLVYFVQQKKVKEKELEASTLLPEVFQLFFYLSYLEYCVVPYFKHYVVLYVVLYRVYSNGIK